MIPPIDAYLSQGETQYIRKLIQPHGPLSEYGIKCAVARRIIADLLSELQVYEHALYRAENETERLRAKYEVSP